MFKMETGVVPILFLIASKCRHLKIRQAAVDLLLKYPNVQENLWVAKRIGSLTARLVEIETEAAKAYWKQKAQILSQASKTENIPDKIYCADFRSLSYSAETDFGIPAHLRITDMHMGTREPDGQPVTLFRNSNMNDPPDKLEVWDEYIRIN